MNLFTIVAILGVGYLLLNRNGGSLLAGSTSIAGGAANQAQQQAQLRALATAVQKGQAGTAQQVSALQQALKQLASKSQQQQGKGGGASGSPSGGGGSSVGTQRNTQTYDPIAQLFLSSNLNSQQSIAAESILKSGGTLDDAAAAAGVDVQSIIGAISPQIESIIRETAPSESITNTDFDGFNPIEQGLIAGPDTSQDAFNQIPGVDGTYSSFDQIDTIPFIDSGTSDYTAGYDGLVQIDPIPLIDTNLVDGWIGQDPATDPSFYQDNSMIDGSFSPSTTDMSSGFNSAAYSDAPWEGPSWNEGGFDSTFGVGGSGSLDGWENEDSLDAFDL
jgi:hypothetical protein